MARHTTDEYGRRVAKALQLLAEGMDTDKVALKVGVRQKTIRAWIDDTEFGIVHDCLRAFGRMKFSRESLDQLKPEAMETLRRLLKDGSGTAAAQAARDVLKWVREFEKEQQAAAKEQEKHTIRVTYGTPDGKPVSIAPWADRNPVTRRPWAGWADEADEERFPRRG